MGVSVAIGVGIGAVVGGGAAAIQSGGDWNAIWKGALVGAVGGAVGGWAAPALTGALGGTLGGMAAGGLGGVTAGVLGTALNGGNSSDYLKNGLMGGLGGAAVGGLGGYFGGAEGAAAEGGVNPVTGEAVPTGTPTTTPLPEGDIATGINQAGSGAGAVEGTVTGPTATPTQGTTTPLGDTGASTVPPLSETAFGPQGSSAFDKSLSQTYGATGASTNTLDTGTAMGTTSGLTPTETQPLYTGESNLDKAYGLNVSPSGPEQINLGNSGTPAAGTNTQPSMMDQFKNWLGGSSKGTGKMGLEDYLKMQGKAQLMGAGMKTLGALATAPETQQNRQQLMDLYNQQNNANQFYQNQLQQTYQNPQAYLSSPEAQATRSAALQKLVAQNAAAGRRTAGSAMQNQLMMNQLQNLQAYRAGMPRANYGTASQVYQNAAQYSPTADIFGGLASGVTPLSLYSLYGG